METGDAGDTDAPDSVDRPVGADTPVDVEELIAESTEAAEAAARLLEELQHGVETAVAGAIDDLRTSRFDQPLEGAAKNALALEHRRIVNAAETNARLAALRADPDRARRRAEARSAPAPSAPSLERQDARRRSPRDRAASAVRGALAPAATETFDDMPDSPHVPDPPDPPASPPVVAPTERDVSPPAVAETVAPPEPIAPPGRRPVVEPAPPAVPEAPAEPAPPAVGEAPAEPAPPSVPLPTTVPWARLEPFVVAPPPPPPHEPEVPPAPIVEPEATGAPETDAPPPTRHTVRWLALAGLAVATAVAAFLGFKAAGGESDGDRQAELAAAVPVAPHPLPGHDRFTSVVAEATGATVDVFSGPEDQSPEQTFENPSELGSPTVFLVTDESRDDRLEVLLPVRPNGSRGWVDRAQVEVGVTGYRVRVDLVAHTLEAFHGEQLVLKAPVGIGRQDTPTPGGSFYITELVQPPNPDTVYGTYAYGLSGFSNTLEQFNGGAGVVGIHGTNDPAGVGKDVSSGCIRLANEDIEELVARLPLGTPVEIVPNRA